MRKPVHYHYGKFPPSNLDWKKLLPLIGPANAALARYDGILNSIPNQSILLTPMTTQEAVLSSKIEGTVTTMAEVLEFEAEKKNLIPKSSKEADIQEVVNYRKAIKQAGKLLEKLPLCQRVIKETHAILMKGVRGRNKSPGDYRLDQNWIGEHNCPIEEARFIPISPEKLLAGMGNWEKFIHEEYLDQLVQLAILHVEFESLHPFGDGNGRIGRMLVPLYLQIKNILKRPMLYISEFFEKHRDDYYDSLLAVSRNDAWTDWCVFFLRALIAQAKANQSKVEAILNLYMEKKSWITEKTHSQYSIRALDYFFKFPIFVSSEFAKNSKIPKPTAQRILMLLQKDGMFRILRQSAGRSPALLAFRELLNIAEGEKVF